MESHPNARAPSNNFVYFMANTHFKNFQYNCHYTGKDSA